MNRHLLAVLAAVGLITVGCGGSTKVGNEAELKKLKSRQNEQLGQITTTTTVAVLGRPVTTTRPVATTRATTGTTRGLPPVTIDERDTDFNPPNPRVRKGTSVTIVNKTDKTVNFSCGNGRWTSDIAPGGKFTFVADITGKFEMSDSGRPFVQGSLEVVE